MNSEGQVWSIRRWLRCDGGVCDLIEGGVLESSTTSNMRMDDSMTMTAPASV